MTEQERLKELVNYDPQTGIFIWLIYRKRTNGIGSRADVKHSSGYRQLAVDGVNWLAHIAAWVYMTGEKPKQLIDHKDTIRDNNIWTNLREATYSQNTRNRKANNKTGKKGVYELKNGKYRAIIQLGTFEKIEEAEEAFDKAAKILHKEFFYKAS